MKKYGLPLLLAVILLALFLPVRVSAAGEYSIELTSDIRDVMEDLGVEALPVGEEICVEVWLSGQATYNAYDISFSYHSDHLKYLRAELVEKTVQNMTSSQILVDEIEETIRIRGYGEDKETAGEPVARIWFETILETNPGKTADVQVQAVTVDHADNAGIQEAPPADKRVDTAKAPIRNFKVEVSGDRLGDKDYIRVDTTIADGSEDVHFWVDAVDGEFVHYEVQVKIAGDDVTGSVIPPDPSKGIDCYTIPMNVILTKQGKIEIILHTIYKEFEVTIRGKDVSGEKKATYSKDYRFKLDRQKGYLYTVDVTIGGKEYTLYRVEEGDTYIIPGVDIVADIVIEVHREKDTSNQVKVSFTGTGAKDGSGKKKAEKGEEYSFTLKRKDGYLYYVDVYVRGKRVVYGYDPELDTFYINGADITGNIVINIRKVPIVEITEYLTLDEKCMYLVAYNGPVPEGQVPRYEGQRMYWSDAYDAYVWLMESEEDEKKVKKTVEANVALRNGVHAGSVDYSGNVDGNRRRDKDDVRLVQQMYNGCHSLEDTDILKLLCADVHADKKLNVQDAATIMSRILAEGGDTTK